MEIAVEEAVREHFQSMHALDEVMRQNVEQISAEKSIIMSARGTLIDLKQRALKWRSAADEHKGEPRSEVSACAWYYVVTLRLS